MEFTVTLTLQLLKKEYARRCFGNLKTKAIALVLSGGAVMLDLSSGKVGYISCAVMTLWGLVCVIYAALWMKTLAGLKKWKRTPEIGKVTYRLSGDFAEAVSVKGSIKLRWDSFDELIIRDDLVSLNFSPSGHFLMPTSQVPNEALDFMKERVLAHSKAVRDLRQKLG